MSFPEALPSSSSSDTPKNHGEDSTENEYVTTLTWEPGQQSTLTEVVFLNMDSLIQVDSSVGTPFLLVTDDTEGHGTMEARILVDNNQTPKIGKTNLEHNFDNGDQQTLLDNKNRENSSQDKQKILRCEFEGCSRTFMWPAHLKYHLLTHTGSRQYKCPFKPCNKRFYTQQRLDVHLRTHTGERPYVCHLENCDKSFTTAGNLKNHMRIHTGERPFLCDIQSCGKRFAELSSLRKHCLVHSGDKPFSCELCGKTFSQIGSRNVHQRRRHPHLLVGEDVGTSADEQKPESPHDDEDVVEMDLNDATSDDSQNEPATLNYCDDSTNMEIDRKENLPREEIHPQRIILPHSNANVLVIAQPQSIPEMGYNLPTTCPSDATVYKNILIEDEGQSS